MPTINWDWGQVKPNFGGGYDAVGPNTYTCVFVSAKDEPTSNNDGTKLVFEAAIQHGRFKGMSIPISFNVGNKNQQAMEIAYGNLAAIAHCIGTIPKGQPFNTDLLLNRPINLTFAVKYLPPRQGNGEGTIVNELRRIGPYENSLKPEVDTEVPPLSELKKAAAPGGGGGFTQPGAGGGFGAGAPSGNVGWSPDQGQQAQQTTQQPQQQFTPPADQGQGQQAAQQPGAGGGWTPPGGQGGGQPTQQPQPGQDRGQGGGMPQAGGQFTPPGGATTGQPAQGGWSPGGAQGTTPNWAAGANR